MAKCPSCGAENTGKFCTQCGAAILQEPGVAPQPAPPAPQPVAPPQPVFAPPPPPPGPQGAPPQPFRPGGPPPIPQPTVPPQPAGKRSVLTMVLAAAGVLLLLILGAAALTGGGEKVGPLVISDQVDAQSKKPLRSLDSLPGNVARIYASSEVSLKQGSKVEVRWYYDTQQLDAWTFRHTFTESYEGYVSPYVQVKAGATLPKGKYTATFLLNGEEKVSKTFEIR